MSGLASPSMLNGLVASTSINQSTSNGCPAPILKGPHSVELQKLSDNSWASAARRRDQREHSYIRLERAETKESGAPETT
mmetsp:Transcript_32679/g.81351  ORF Transcript_32679/g.81351 Transcript_32679/m.81351 type:complete len:80 (+) Transcript_32679:1568-1807(+)